MGHTKEMIELNVLARAAATSKNPIDASDKIVVSSKSSSPTTGTGLDFRSYNYVELKIQFRPDKCPGQWGCLDSRCGMSLIESEFMTKELPNATIEACPLKVDMRGIGKNRHQSDKLIVLEFYGRMRRRKITGAN